MDGNLPQKKLKGKKGKRPLMYNNVWKKRSVALILNTVQRKLRRLLSEYTDHPEDAIERALSNPDAEKVL